MKVIDYTCAYPAMTCQNAINQNKKNLFIPIPLKDNGNLSHRIKHRQNHTHSFWGEVYSILSYC